MEQGCRECRLIQIVKTQFSGRPKQVVSFQAAVGMKNIFFTMSRMSSSVTVNNIEGNGAGECTRNSRE